MLGSETSMPKGFSQDSAAADDHSLASDRFCSHLGHDLYVSLGSRSTQFYQQYLR